LPQGGQPGVPTLVLGRFFQTHTDGPQSSPSLLYNGCQGHHFLYAEEIQQCESSSHSNTKRSMPEMYPSVAGLPEEVNVQKGSMLMVARLGFAHILFTINYAQMHGTLILRHIILYQPLAVLDSWCMLWFCACHVACYVSHSTTQLGAQS